MAGEGEEEAEQEEEDDDRWEEELMAAVTAPPPNLVGLPQGLRIRSVPAKQAGFEACKTSAGRESAASMVAAAGLRPSSRWEVWALGLFCAISVLITGRFFYQWLLPVSPGVENWRRGCRQCRHEWWDDFWHWRLKGITAKGGGSSNESGLPHEPPPGMEWEWGRSVNDTDWYGASPELVDSVIKVFADPALGPLLQIGCGDSPLPELLHRAGFNVSEHLDVAPEVITALRTRHPVKEWPGMHFQVRDFLTSGATPPAHRFGAVIDKAGIWDWLQEEAPHALARLLANVRRALVEGSEQQGVYIIATKQTPSDFSQSLSKAAVSGGGTGFLVEATQPLGNKGIAWAYVLIPV